MSTLPSLLLERAASSPLKVAVRRFTLGTWQETTWGALRDEAAAVGTGLASLGVGRGDVVAVITEDGPEWFAVEIGAQGIGATVLGLGDDLSPAALVSVLRSTGAKVAIVADQEQYDKVEDARSELPALAVVTVIDTRGLRHIDRPGRSDALALLSLDQLRALGSTPSAWEVAARSVGDDYAAVIVTSVVDRTLETTPLTHREAIAHGEAVSTLLDMHAADTLYTLHAFAEAGEHAFGLVGPLLSGATVHFGEAGLEAQGLRQVQPTLLCAEANWLAAGSVEVGQREAAAGGLKRIALRRGFVRRPPVTAVRTSRYPNPTRMVALAAAAVVGLLFLLWPRGNDVARLLVALGIILVTCAGLVVSGRTVQGPLRRRFGLSRCRGVAVSNDVPTSDAALLGAIDVPLVMLPRPTGASISRTASESRS